MLPTESGYAAPQKTKAKETIVPLADLLLCRAKDGAGEFKTASGIVIPAEAQARNDRAEVIAVGPKVETEAPMLVPGVSVIVNPHAAEWIDADNMKGRNVIAGQLFLIRLGEVYALARP